MKSFTTVLATAIIIVSVAMPFVTQAQTTTAPAPSVQQLIALYTQLVQLLEQELAQLTTNNSQPSTATHVCPNYTTPACINGTLAPQGTDANGCKMPSICEHGSAATSTVFIFPTFSASPISGTAPLTVQFTVTATQQYPLVLDFGDNTQPSVIHCETIPGGCRNELLSHTYTSAGISHGAGASTRKVPSYNDMSTSDIRHSNNHSFRGAGFVRCHLTIPQSVIQFRKNPPLFVGVARSPISHRPSNRRTP